MSQQRTEAAMAKGYFDKEIVPVPVTIRKDTTLVNKDEFPKAGTTAEGLSKLRPVFVKVIFVFYRTNLRRNLHLVKNYFSK